MNKKILLAAAMTAFVFSGCATFSKDLVSQKASKQGAVFEEVKDSGPQRGFSILAIKISLKTLKRTTIYWNQRAPFTAKPNTPLFLT